eukprot:6177138-Pleurochrysis_carterae.AAC.2
MPLAATPAWRIRLRTSTRRHVSIARASTYQQARRTHARTHADASKRERQRTQARSHDPMTGDARMWVPAISLIRSYERCVCMSFYALH